MKYNLCYYIRISFLILSLNVIVTKNGTAHKRKTSLTKGPLIDLKMCVHVDKSWNLNGEWEEKCEIARFCPVIVDRLTDYLLFGSIQNYFPTKCMRVCVYLKSIGNNRDVLLVVTDYYYWQNMLHIHICVSQFPRYIPYVRTKWISQYQNRKRTKKTINVIHHGLCTAQQTHTHTVLLVV